MYEEIQSKIQNLKENNEYKGNRKILNKISTELDELRNDDNNIKDYNKINRKISNYEKIIKAFQSTINLDPGRLIGLTDGIFSIVMTLLIFSIKLPDMELATYSNLISFIFNLLPTMGITVIGFILISTFWIYHHEFIKIKKLNIPFLWLNIIFLISISFIPFTTSIIGSYSRFFLSEIIFSLNILLVLVSFTLMYYYAYSRNFLEVEPTRNEIRYVINTLLIIMGLTIIISLLDYFISPNLIYLFLLVPVITTLREILYKIKNLE